MFNAEKYIGDCLNSILAQTFSDFEVIIVDDCSTDSSYEIVQSYAPKFSGRLNLTHTEKNSGGCAVPRNVGLPFSRGEYIFFMDADDLITTTAIEELFLLAKNFDADVVYCEEYYQMNADGTELFIGKSADQNVKLIDKPTLETTDMTQRLQKILQGEYSVMAWQKFVRRKLLFEHENFFPHVCPSEDVIWTYGLVFYAKKFLRVPNVVYIHRQSEDSIMRSKKTPQQLINFWLNPVLLGVRNVDKLMSKLDFFRQNPQYRYAVLERFINSRMLYLINESFQLPPFAVYEAIKQEFGDRLGEYDVLIPALCTHINTLQKIQLINNQKFNEFAEQAQERISQLEEQLQNVRK